MPPPLAVKDEPPSAILPAPVATKAIVAYVELTIELMVGVPVVMPFTSVALD